MYILRLLEAHASALADSPSPIGDSGRRTEGKDPDTDLGQPEVSFIKFVDSGEQDRISVKFPARPYGARNSHLLGVLEATSHLGISSNGY